METGLALQSSFSSLSSRSRYPHLHQRNPTLALYTGTFRAITSDWSKHKHSLGTQKLLLDIAMSHRWQFDGYYPALIVDEFLSLLSNIFEGQTGPHIDEARQQFESYIMKGPRRFRERVLRVLTGRRQPEDRVPC